MDDCFNLIGFEKGYEQGKNDAKKECDNCLFSTRKEKIDEAYQKGRADAIDEMLDAIAQEVAYSYKTLNYSKVAQIAEKLKEQK